MRNGLLFGLSLRTRGIATPIVMPLLGGGKLTTLWVWKSAQ
jgi:hypothetical protein